MSEFGLFNIKIRDFIQSIKTGKYQLPCFQRDFKWNPAKIKSLMNSIQHEYPAGSLLFLKVDSANPLIPYQAFKYADESAFTEKTEKLVLDGQQRMTSCFSVFTNTGYYTYYINYIDLMNRYRGGDQDIDFESVIVHKRHNSTPFTEIPNGLFPMAYLIDRNTMRSQIRLYVQDVEKDSSKKDICDFLNYDFGNIVDSILDYEFPVVELPENSSMESVCKVFQTINTTGLKLSVFDICVAVFMPKNINLKEMVKNASSTTRYAKMILDKDPTSVLQVVALLANKAPNSNTLPKELEAQDITDYWDDAVKGIDEALILFDDYGAGTKKNLAILPYTPMVPIVAAVLIRTKYATMDVPKKAAAENKIRSYFFTASLSTRYTEGTNAKINEDFKALNQWISNNVEPTMITHGVDWNTSKVIANNKNGAFGKAVLCVLNKRGLKDFYSQSISVGVGEHIESCDLHHIFPKAAYEDTNEDLINSVFNYTWLIKDTNIYIQDKRTYEYLDSIKADVGVSEAQLKTVLADHMIDNSLYTLMQDEDYYHFISQRADMFKTIFENYNVVFRSVDADELEVEEDENEDDDE